MGSNDQYQHKWKVLGAVGTGVFLATVDGSIVNVSLPTMVTSLQTSFTLIQWVVLSYLLSVTTLLLGFGRLADIFGKKNIYRTGFVIFTIASACCGLSQNVQQLILFRILQGIGGAMIMALGPAIITQAFPPSERGRAMGTIGSIVSIGIVIGPALGGFILQLLSWQWIFYVNLPFGVIGLWMVGKFIPAMAPVKKQSFDLAGAVILFVTLLSLLAGLSLSQQFGFQDGKVIFLLALALIGLVVFILVEARVQQPMMHLSLFRNPLLSVNLVTSFISFFALGGIFILIPFYLETILGFPSMKVGLLMSVIPVMMGIFSPLSGTLADKLGSRPMIITGLLVLSLSYLFASLLRSDGTAFSFILHTMGIGVGTGIFLSPNNSSIMGASPKQHLGIVSSLMALSRTLGQTVGISVISTLWALRIHHLAGDFDNSNVSAAPVALQMSGLQFVFVIVSLLVIVGLGFSVYGYYLEQRLQAD